MIYVVSRRLLLSLVILIAVVCVGTLAMISLTASSNVQDVQVSDDMIRISEDFYQSIDNITGKISLLMHSSAKELATLTPDDPRTVEVLREMHYAYPKSAGVAWVSPDNNVITYPAFSLSLVLSAPELKTITEQSFASVDILLIGPVESNTYGMVICFVVPVYAEDGSYNGYLCFAQSPITLLNETPDTPYYKDTNYELWVVNSSGVTLFHPDLALVGSNYYTSSYFQKHANLASGLRPIFVNPSGTATYQFYALGSSDIVDKTAIWRTLSFGGQDLRLVLSDYPHKEQNISFPKNTDLTEIANITEALFLYAKKHGKEETFASMSDPYGPFSNTDSEIFAISSDGVILSMPSRNNIVGENRINSQDAYGMRPVASMINRYMQGGGYVHSYTTIPYSGYQTILNLAYVIPVDDTWFVGAQKPVFNYTVTHDYLKRPTLVRAVQTAQNYTTAHGKEQTLDTLMDPSGELANTGVHLFAVSYDGKLLADIANPTVIGDDIFSFTDPHGTSVTRGLVLIAKQGGGFGYVETQDDATHISSLSLIYVEPVDGDWFIGGAINLNEYYTSPTEGDHT